MEGGTPQEATRVVALLGSMEHAGLLPSPRQPELGESRWGRWMNPRPQSRAGWAHGERSGQGRARGWQAEVLESVQQPGPGRGRPFWGAHPGRLLLTTLLCYQEISEKHRAQHFLLRAASQPHN